MYQLQISNRASKALEKIPDAIYQRLIPAIKELANNPRPSGSKKLKGHKGYRIWVSDYRIIYEINDRVLVVLVIDVGHRREIYE